VRPKDRGGQEVRRGQGDSAEGLRGIRRARKVRVTWVVYLHSVFAPSAFAREATRVASSAVRSCVYECVCVCVYVCVCVFTFRVLYSNDYGVDAYCS
jgi:hypothetical protein